MKPIVTPIVITAAFAVGVGVGWTARGRERPVIQPDPPAATPSALPRRPPPAPAPRPSTSGEWREDDEAFAWPTPPPRMHEITRVDDTHFMVDRALVELALDKQPLLLRSARLIPAHEDGVIKGVKLFALRRDSLLDRLGFRNGDRVDAVNGLPMDAPDKALDAFVHLRTTTRLAVAVQRKGAPLTLHYLITTSSVPGDAGLELPDSGK